MSDKPHNRIASEILTVVAFLTLASPFSTTALTCIGHISEWIGTLQKRWLSEATTIGTTMWRREACDHSCSELLGFRESREEECTFVATPPLFSFFATPVGLAPVFLLAGRALGLRLMTGAVSTVWKTRGLELPVADLVPSRAILCATGYQNCEQMY